MSQLGRVGAIVAARFSSTRLPGKAMRDIRGLPMLAFLLRRLKSSTSATVVFATSNTSDDDVLAVVAKDEGIPVYRGSLDDVVSRYVEAASYFGFDSVVRITGDCPFVNGELVDFCVETARRHGSFDLCTTKGLFPVGLDAEIYNSEQMALLSRSGLLSAQHREHLTLYFYEHSSDFDIVPIEPPTSWAIADRQYTVDTPTDYERAVRLANQFDTPTVSLSRLVELDNRAH